MIRSCDWSGRWSGARPAGPSFPPLDDCLGVLSFHFSPTIVEQIVRLGTPLPFEQVPEALLLFRGVHVSVDTARRLTEAAGQAQVAVEERAEAVILRQPATEPTGPETQAISVDGVMVPLRKGTRAEVRLLAIGTVDADTRGAVHTTELSYFARLCKAQGFIDAVTVPFHARGTMHAGTVVARSDGASWIQELIDAHRPDAVRILDFAHAAGYVSQAAQACWGPGTEETATWLSTWRSGLKTEPVEVVLAAVKALPATSEEAKAARSKAVNYLSHRRQQIAYANFQKLGYPIGSGMVESGCKLVIEARLKGSGMHWAGKNVTPMVALRSILCSHQWREAWAGIWQEWREQAKRERRERWLTKHPPAPSPLPASLRHPILPQDPMGVDGRPTEHHPWPTSQPAFTSVRLPERLRYHVTVSAHEDNTQEEKNDACITSALPVQAREYGRDCPPGTRGAGAGVPVDAGIPAL